MEILFCIAKVWFSTRRSNYVDVIIGRFSLIYLFLSVIVALHIFLKFCVVFIAQVSLPK